MAPLPQTKPISLRRVDAELWKQLGVQARLRDTSLTALVQRILREWLDRPTHIRTE